MIALVRLSDYPSFRSLYRLVIYGRLMEAPGDSQANERAPGNHGNCLDNDREAN